MFFLMKSFLYCLYFGNIFFLDLKKKKIHHSICCCSSDRRASIKHQTCLDLSRKRRSQSQYIGNKQTALWEKIVLFFRLRSSVACSKFCHNFFLVFASVTPIFIVYFFLGTAVSRRFKTSNNQVFFFFTPCFHNIFSFRFFQFRMNNQLINICLFVCL